MTSKNKTMRKNQIYLLLFHVGQVGQLNINSELIQTNCKYSNFTYVGQDACLRIFFICIDNIEATFSAKKTLFSKSKWVTL